MHLYHATGRMEHGLCHSGIRDLVDIFCLFPSCDRVSVIGRPVLCNEDSLTSLDASKVATSRLFVQCSFEILRPPT